jgi:hypothetical protein
MNVPLNAAALRNLRGFAQRAVCLLGSLKLAVPLLGVLAAVIGFATVLEADYGREYAQWRVYHSGWFIALLALLGVNIFAAAASRWPWKRHQTGFVVTHGGLLTLLAGAVLTFVGGVDGRITLAEGQTTARMLVPQQSQITASWANRPGEPPYEFSFVAGPADWAAGQTLDVGEVDGVRARVLRYYHQARVREDWVADGRGTGGPMIRLRLAGPNGVESEEHVLADQDYGDEAVAGPLRLRLRRAASDAMLEAFRSPPADGLGRQGILLAYHRDGVTRIPVDDNVGKRFVLDDSGAAVEIAEYLANARPDARGRFRSAGEQPQNPLLELRVYPPGQETPVRQVAFARNPLLTLDPVLGRACPVRFEYHHPAVRPEAAVDFLQTADGHLYYRTAAEGRFVAQGSVQAGGRIDAAGRFSIALVEHLPSARQHIVYEPVETRPDQPDRFEAAAEVAISAGGVTQTIWLPRTDPRQGSRTVITPKGPLRVSFHSVEAPLGFSLRLASFRRDRNPGGVGNATFSSTVCIVDDHGTVEKEYDITMNRPLTYNGLTFYQSGFNDAEQGPPSSTFSVGHDPGRTLKYAGSLLVCLGIATMFYMRAYFFKNVAPGRESRRTLRSARSPAAGPDSRLAAAAPQPNPGGWL